MTASDGEEEEKNTCITTTLLYANEADQKKKKKEEDFRAEKLLHFELFFYENKYCILRLRMTKSKFCRILSQKIKK